MIQRRKEFGNPDIHMEHSTVSGTGRAPRITGWLVAVMATACGVAVANIYFNQPLLVDIGHTFGVEPALAARVATVTQFGYALGLFLFVPLGDRVDRRKLILVLSMIVTAALAAAAVSPNLPWLVAASAVIGVTTVVPQIIVPFAAALADNRQRGTVLSRLSVGFTLGVLGARVAGGFLAAALGWRAVYWIAAGCMVALAVLMAASLPRDCGKSELSYPALLSSLPRLLQQEPVLRQACLSQSMIFGAFSAFWTNLALLLSTPPYHFGSREVGLFGVIGLAGTLTAPVVGWLVDRKGPGVVQLWSAVATLVAYGLFWTAGHWIAVLAAGAILLNAGTQSNQIVSQVRIFSVRPEARNRMNAVYMVCVFLGSSFGSLLSTYGWALGQWQGVCAAGLAMALIPLLVWIGSAPTL
ncbi:MAG: MFS transporter, partial [Alicyclobacillaceae bacterium]|nr:MFS transporter [Alicyclobacillaceae bacterium]